MPQDYVSVVATTESVDILLVQQYRPTVEGPTLDLPSGHVEADQTPEEAARCELLEETCYQAQEMELLGKIIPDTGRLGNTLWALFAPQVQFNPEQPPEAGIEVTRCTPSELKELVTTGQLNNALNMAVLLLAMQQGKMAYV